MGSYELVDLCAVFHQDVDPFVKALTAWQRKRKASDHLLSYMVGHSGAKSFEVIKQTKHGSSRYTRPLGNDLGRRHVSGFSYEVHHRDDDSLAISLSPQVAAVCLLSLVHTYKNTY